MNRKFLDETFKVLDTLGVDEEQLKQAKKSMSDKIMDENGKQIEKHNTEVATLQNDIKVQKNLVDELNGKIKKNSEVDIEAIKTEQFELGKKEGLKETETFKKFNALENALKEVKAKDTKLLQKLIDSEKLNYEEKDGVFNISGLNEQVDELKKTHEYLFEKEEPKAERMSTGTETGAQTQAQTEQVQVKPMFKTY